MDFIELAKARYSCRKFSPKHVEPEKLAKTGKIPQRPA